MSCNQILTSAPSAATCKEAKLDRHIIVAVSTCLTNKIILKGCTEVTDLETSAGCETEFLTTAGLASAS